MLVDTAARSKTRYKELPKDMPPKEALFDNARDVESMLPVATAEELLASGTYDFAKKLVERFGQTVFLHLGGVAPFPFCFCVLSTS